ncbi:hypothetical protein [Latilactobacillus curvatus]|uniref:hypothetical protein n=1 Tax=Latilactobacillus curvatus TaxID=28038 RepID=UPI0020A2B638|nr:hypothetical protein [Latilactobacillus curvatus]
MTFLNLQPTFGRLQLATPNTTIVAISGNGQYSWQHWQAALTASRSQQIGIITTMAKWFKRSTQDGHVTLLTPAVDETLTAIKKTKIWD